jgi:hypothetical protein
MKKGGIEAPFFIGSDCFLQDTAGRTIPFPANSGRKIHSWKLSCHTKLCPKGRDSLKFPEGDQPQANECPPTHSGQVAARSGIGCERKTNIRLDRHLKFTVLKTVINFIITIILFS